MRAKRTTILSVAASAYLPYHEQDSPDCHKQGIGIFHDKILSPRSGRLLLFPFSKTSYACHSVFD